MLLDLKSTVHHPMNKLLLLLLVLISGFAQAQSTKIIMHLQSADTLVHKSVVNQVSNLKKEFPGAEIELVCHGPGLEFLMKKNSTYVNQVNAMKLSSVSFAGCEFTMKQKNVSREDLVPYTTTVPFGVAEIIKKQQQDWIYIKLGW